MMSPTEILLSEIEEFVARQGMAPSAFGSSAVGDPSLVIDLRAGRELRFGTIQRIRRFMESAMCEDRA